ncbi:potassium-transporting ATPase subunit C [Saccharopolyspora phatthalungensis]|uniref:Potassium-transporting ATPase KdpC subunit n=1 Tax=Saccharopolyspora phatthalungensis TaxID=664693 RepID=A0A840QEM6_9PSEU|nr:potassium-transporting ATPase subunit C [Saccharopolyspora phatthalungensis]MBB5155483.1 K+-transporting ATPase ATPase C chain [Saccharopolyspora phatthalungensis]
MKNTLLRQTLAGLRLLLVATVVLGVAYPLTIWAISRIPGLQARAEGSQIVVDGRVVGSSLIGIDPVPADPANDPYFHTRPAASAEGGLGPGDPSTSGGSNYGGASEDLLAVVWERRTAIALREGVAPEQVPTDAVTASASGVDPHISPAYAQLQAPRVARVTGLPVDEVRRLIAENTTGGFVSERVVNATTLNVAVHRTDLPGQGS